MLTKAEQLKRIQRHVNEWESSDKEGLLMEVLEDYLSSEQLAVIMSDQNIPIVDGIETPE